MTRKISTADLLRLGACRGQGVLFEETFKNAGEGVAVTVDNILVARGARLDLSWLARHIFTDPAWDTYKRTCGMSREELDSYLTAGDERSWHAYAARRGSHERTCAAAWVAAYETSISKPDKGDE